MILLFDVMLSYLLNPYWKPLCTECVDLFCNNFGQRTSAYIHTMTTCKVPFFMVAHWAGHTSLLIIIATCPKRKHLAKDLKGCLLCIHIHNKHFELCACLTCSACFLLCICNVHFDLYAAQQLLPLSNSTQFGRAVQFTAVRDSYLGLFGTNHQPTPVTKISRSAQNAPFQL